MPYEVFARLHTALLSSSLRRQEGQGTVEYVGVVMLVAVLIGTIVTAMRGDSSIAASIVEKVKSAIADVGGGGRSR